MHKISTKHILIKLLTLSIIVLLFTSCERSANDRLHPLFIKAQNCYDNGNYTEAIKLYKRYLNLNPNSAKASYQLASIYQEQGEYIQAIFYYEKYLMLNPDTSDKKIIQEWIEASKEQLLKQLEQSTKTDTEESQKALLEELDSLKIKNEKMRDFILRHKDKIISKHQSTTINAQKTPEATQPNSKSLTQATNFPKIYTVQPGDTLYKISKKFYGTPKYYKLIMKANSKLLNSSSKLIPGYKLTIPVIQ